MVGPPRGPPRPTMAPQQRAPAPSQPPPPQQFILKQVASPLPMLKPPAKNYMNLLSLPMVPTNGSFFTVNSKPGETNGTTFLAMSPRPSYLVTKGNENNNTTFITMDSPPPASAPPLAHQYLIPSSPKPEPFATHNYSKNEPAAMLKRKMPVPTRPTNHQRIVKEEEEEEGEEVKPVLDPEKPRSIQLVHIDHNYPSRLPTVPPVVHEDDKESTISSDERNVEHTEEGEETETAVEGEEDNVTRCICNFEHDDGYMISCDRCYVWQHVACVLPDIPVANSLPDMTYLCDICQPRDLDRSRARALQVQRRKQILQRDDSSDDSWSSTDRFAPPPKKTAARMRAEAIPRKRNKSYSIEGPLKNKHKNTYFGGGRKLDSSSPDSPIKTKHLKPLNRGRKDPTKSLTSSALSQASQSAVTSVGRRTKLKRKFEFKVNRRKKGKIINSISEPKVEKPEEERRKPVELRPRAPTIDRTPTKARCRLVNDTSGDPMVVTTGRASSGDLLTELRGKYLQSIPTTPKADVLFHYRFPRDGTEVILDGTGKENIMRYARRSCHPNSQLKHCSVKGSLQLYVVAMEALEKNQQVTIPHGSVTDNINSSRECCGKDCTLNNPKPASTNTNASVVERRRSRRRTISEDSDGSPIKRDYRCDEDSPLSPTHSEKDRKLTREEKKIEQAMKIFAQMERDTARKMGKERSGPRRPGDSDKESAAESGKVRRRRRRRRRRSSRKSRLSSTSGGAGANSGDESDVSSGDDLPSPRDKNDSKDSEREEEDDKIVGMNDAAGLLLALGGPRRNNSQLPGRRTPPTARENSENDSSPSTPLSSACLLVAAAVGPLAPGFKFPKTKKGMMNEWLSRSPEHGASDVSPSTELGPPIPPSDLPLPPGAPKLSNLSSRLYCPIRDSPAGTVGFGKKRWLRQAISEEIESPLGSPPCQQDSGTPLKKRRLARESLNSEPPTTPPLGLTPTHTMDYNSFGGESPNQYINGANDLAERVKKMQRDYEAAQEYDTSPQRVPENLSLPPAPTSPSSDDDIRPRRNRKRPVIKAELRVSPRIRRKQKRPEKIDVGDKEQPELDKKTDECESKADAAKERISEADGEKISDTDKDCSEVKVEETDTTGKVRADTEEKLVKVEKLDETADVVKNCVDRTDLAKVEPNDVVNSVDIDKIDSSSSVKTVTKDEPPTTTILETPPEKTLVDSSNDSEPLKKETPDPEIKPEPVSEPVTSPVNEVNGGCDEPDSKKTAAEVSVIQPPLNSAPSVIKQTPVSEPPLAEAPPVVDQPVTETPVTQLSVTATPVVEQAAVGETPVAETPPVLVANNFAPPLPPGNPPAAVPVLDNQASLAGGRTDPRTNSSIAEPVPTPPVVVAPVVRRKLSLTEYLKRKKVAPVTKPEPIVIPKADDTKEQAPLSPASDDDLSPLLLPTPTLPLPFFDGPKSNHFKVEPTELERQRENLNERLRREFGLMISDDDPPTVETTNGFPESKFSYDEVQTLPQSAIYPVGSSNPPNPFTTPFPSPERRKFRK